MVCSLATSSYYPKHCWPLIHLTPSNTLWRYLNKYAKKNVSKFYLQKSAFLFRSEFVKNFTHLYFVAHCIRLKIMACEIYYPHRILLSKYSLKPCIKPNKANLRDLIAATGLVILLKLDSNNWFFILYDIEIRWMTSKNKKAPLLGHIKLSALFQSHQWIQTGVTIHKCSIQVNFLSPVTLKFDRWPWKTTGHLFCATSSFMRHFIAIYQFKLELQSGNVKFGSKSTILCPVWPWNLTDNLGNNRAPHITYFKLCASFHSHRSIQTIVTVRKRQIRVKIGNYSAPCDLEIWQ